MSSSSLEVVGVEHHPAELDSAKCPLGEFIADLATQRARHSWHHRRQERSREMCLYGLGIWIRKSV